MLKFANEENTCPYSANLLGSCASIQFYRHRVPEAAQFAAAKVPIQHQESWVKIGCSHSRNTVQMAHSEKTEMPSLHCLD